MAYTEALKRAIYKYREKHREELRIKQKQYSHKHYINNKAAMMGTMKVRREFLRLARAFEAGI